MVITPSRSLFAQVIDVVEEHRAFVLKKMVVRVWDGRYSDELVRDLFCLVFILRCWHALLPLRFFTPACLVRLRCAILPG